MLLGWNGFGILYRGWPPAPRLRPLKQHSVTDSDSLKLSCTNEWETSDSESKR